MADKLHSVADLSAFLNPQPDSGIRVGRVRAVAERNGYTEYIVSTPHPVSGKMMVIASVRESTPRFYQADQGRINVSDLVSLKESGQQLEIAGVIPEGADVEQPPATIQVGGTETIVQKDSIDNHVGESSQVIDNSGIRQNRGVNEIAVTDDGTTLLNREWSAGNVDGRMFVNEPNRIAAKKEIYYPVLALGEDVPGVFESGADGMRAKVVIPSQTAPAADHAHDIPSTFENTHAVLPFYLADKMAVDSGAAGIVGSIGREPPSFTTVIWKDKPFTFNSVDLSLVGLSKSFDVVQDMKALLSFTIDFPVAVPVNEYTDHELVFTGGHTIPITGTTMQIEFTIRPDRAAVALFADGLTSIPFIDVEERKPFANGLEWREAYLLFVRKSYFIVSNIPMSGGAGSIPVADPRQLNMRPGDFAEFAYNAANAAGSGNYVGERVMDWVQPFYVRHKTGKYPDSPWGCFGIRAYRVYPD